MVLRRPKTLTLIYCGDFCPGYPSEGGTCEFPSRSLWNQKGKSEMQPAPGAGGEDWRLSQGAECEPHANGKCALMLGKEAGEGIREEVVGKKRDS